SRDVWFDGGPPPYLHVTQGTVTIDNGHEWMNLTDYPQSAPAVDLSNLNGKVTLLNPDIGNSTVISGNGTNAQVLGLAVLRDQPAPTGSYFYNNASPAATAGLLNSRQWTTLPDQQTVPTPNQGTIDSTFVTSMIAQARGDHAPMLTPIANGVSDVRLYRVYALLGTNNILLAPAAPPTAAAPTVQVSIDHSDVNIAIQTALVTFAFNEPINDFSILGSTTVTGGALSNLQTTDGGNTYTATFTPTANADISKPSVGVGAGSSHDLAGPAGPGGSTPLFTVDTVTPTVTVTISNNDVNVTNSTATVTFSFSEAPTSFVLADTAATGGTLSNLVKVDATHYTATFTAAANILINYASVSVTSGSWSENNGNPGAGGATANFTVDTFDHWINSAGGDWATAANWGNGVPTANLAADIDASGTYRVTISSADTTCGLLINAAGAAVSDNTGGSLSITGSGGPSNPNGALTIRAGSFALAGGGLPAGSITLQDSGSLEFGTANSENVTFAAGASGTLKIDHSLTAPFTGSISGLTTNNAID